MPYKDKCFSTCREFEKDDCNPPRCKYINGPTLEYCRISHKYKMNKPKCNVTRRIKKSEQKAYATNKISEMIKRSGKFLQTICSDSGDCISFGKHVDEITHFFNGFTNFDHVDGDIQRLGKPSANGFVKEIAYEKQGYKAYAILKSSQNPTADNLVYEYLVGIKFINRIVKQYPCFVQTYGLYFYDNNEAWKYMKNTMTTQKLYLKQLNHQNTIDYGKACTDSKYACILIQHIKHAKPLSDFLSVGMYTRFIKNDLLYVLFIVYQALASLSKVFTHYDLHSGNVLLYEPVKGKYIQYNYHQSDGSTIVFYSPYIVKIIDYGRSFFDNGNVNSRKIYDKICTVNECKPECGAYAGLGWLHPTPELFISSSQKNESHDLRLVKNIQINMSDIFNIVHTKPNESTFVETDKILNKIAYGSGIHEKAHTEFGTRENLKSSIKKKIYNVNAVYKALKEAVEMPNVSAKTKRIIIDFLIY